MRRQRQTDPKLQDCFARDVVLRTLMEAKGLSQSDLAEIVPQSNLSAILAGKRNISAGLAGYFKVNLALFIAH